MNPAVLRAFAHYNTGVQRARDAYREDQLRSAGRCTLCERRWTGASRLCASCRDRRLRARKR
jgi:hypothetical protein